MYRALYADNAINANQAERKRGETLFLDLEVVNVEETIVALSPSTALQRTPHN